MDTFIIAEENERFVSEFAGQCFAKFEARCKAREFSNRVGRTVYIWNVESLQANRKPVEVIHPLRAGHRFSLLVNQGYRDARIVVLLGGQALVEYTMPNGTTGLRVMDAWEFTGEKFEKIVSYGKCVSYRSVPIRWLKAMVDAGREWDGNPQLKNGKHPNVCSAEEMLSSKTSR